MKQLDQESQTKLGKNIRKRIAAADDAIEKILFPEGPEGPKKSDLTQKEESDLQYLRLRWAMLQMSYRLTFNTNWLQERREEDIKTIGDKLTKDDLNETDRSKYTKQLNLQVRSKSCKKCNGRGYHGLNISTGEYSLCSCTMKTLHYY